MIFVDSNIPMHLVGADHPNKIRAQRVLERLIHARERLVTSVEVFQEILHRYTAIGRREAIEPAWSALEDIIDEVFGLDIGEVAQARDLVVEDTNLSARDALLAAVMRHHAIKRILSFDRSFDAFADFTRIE